MSSSETNSEFQTIHHVEGVDDEKEGKICVKENTSEDELTKTIASEHEKRVHAVEMMIINNTQCRCRIEPRFHDFSCHYCPVKDQFIQEPLESLDPVELSEGERLVMFSNKGRSEDCDSLSSDEMIICKLETGKIFKRIVTRFSVLLCYLKDCDLYVPTLVGKTRNPQTTRLNCTNGFFVKKYMDPRHCYYIIEICAPTS